MSFSMRCQMETKMDLGLPSINFSRLKAIELGASVGLFSVGVYAAADFEIATGDSQCTGGADDWGCIQGFIKVGIEVIVGPIDGPSVIVQFVLDLDGLWRDPLNLWNFGIQ